MKLFVPWQQPSSLDNHRDTGPEIDSTFSKLFENLTLEVTTRSACHFLPCRLLKSNWLLPCRNWGLPIPYGLIAAASAILAEKHHLFTYIGIQIRSLDSSPPKQNTSNIIPYYYFAGGRSSQDSHESESGQDSSTAQFIGLKRAKKTIPRKSILFSPGCFTSSSSDLSSDWLAKKKESDFEVQLGHWFMFPEWHIFWVRVLLTTSYC